MIIAVAVFAPLPKTFDYVLPWEGPCQQTLVGCRVQVPFGRRRLVGIIVATKSQSDYAPLKSVLALLDETPLLSEADLTLLTWVSDYYQYPLGEVLAVALPTWWRSEKRVSQLEPVYYQLAEGGGGQLPEKMGRARKQEALLDYCASLGKPVDSATLKKAGFSGAVLKAVVEKGFLSVVPRETPRVASFGLAESPLTLNEEQAAALVHLKQTSGFRVTLLFGVTGSGKTEVYLQWIAAALSGGGQALILVPEIALTPQTLERFQKRFQASIVCLHSELNERERAEAWLSAKRGEAQIVIGTRSAVFVPLLDLKLIVVDEEHDASFHQQVGLRYGGRDVAILRAKQSNVPIVLGSATPSLETLCNVAHQRYDSVSLNQRVGQQSLPAWTIVDVRSQALQAGMSEPLLEKMRQHLSEGRQVLLFLNRRGFAPVFLCHHCGWMKQCAHCDAYMTLHRAPQRLICHHCGFTSRPEAYCPDCQQAKPSTTGVGTEQVEEVLSQLFPEYPVMRVDRDTTRSKGSRQALLDRVVSGEASILIGTQMLAKGHHFPRLSLVGILEADNGFFSSDFRAMERMAQLWWQVSGRAGRELGLKGEVVLQTHRPEDEHLQLLLQQGYPALSQALLFERKQAKLPPYTHWAKWVVEAKSPEQAQASLMQIKQWLLAQIAVLREVELFGPMPQLMEKKAGFYHYELVIQSDHRVQLQRLLSMVRKKIEQTPLGRHIRCAVQVDA